MKWKVMLAVGDGAEGKQYIEVGTLTYHFRFGPPVPSMCDQRCGSPALAQAQALPDAPLRG